MKLIASTDIDILDFEDANELAEHIRCRLDKEFLADDIKQFGELEDYFYLETEEEIKFANEITEEEINSITKENINIDDIETGDDVIRIWFSCNFN